VEKLLNYPRPELARQIKARLEVMGMSCGENLCSHYADQALATGEKTTPEDAFSAWLKWIDSEGGEPVNPLRLEACAPSSHGRTAAVIREVSRYRVS
jgi:hypothetical protein